MTPTDEARVLRMIADVWKWQQERSFAYTFAQALKLRADEIDWLQQGAAPVAPVQQDGASPSPTAADEQHELAREWNKSRQHIYDRPSALVFAGDRMAAELTRQKQEIERLTKALAYLTPASADAIREGK